jgi:hypothetical protein
MQIIDLDGKTYDVKLRPQDPRASGASVVRQYEVSDGVGGAGRVIVANDGLHRTVTTEKPEVFDRVVDGFLKARRRMGDQRCDFLETVAMVVDHLESEQRPERQASLERAYVELLEALLDYARTFTQSTLVAYDAPPAHGKSHGIRFLILRGEDRFREVQPGFGADGVQAVHSVRPEDVLRAVPAPEALLDHLARHIPVEPTTAQAIETLYGSARAIREARAGSLRRCPSH